MLFVMSVVVIILIRVVTDTAKKRRLIKERKNDSICTFARSFDCHSIDPWVIRAAYEGIGSYMICDEERVPLRADDFLFNDLNIDHEDLDGSLKIIMNRSQRSYEDMQFNPYYGRVKTIRDLIMFCNLQPKLTEKGEKL